MLVVEVAESVTVVYDDADRKDDEFVTTKMVESGVVRAYDEEDEKKELVSILDEVVEALKMSSELIVTDALDETKKFRLRLTYMVE